MESDYGGNSPMDTKMAYGESLQVDPRRASVRMRLQSQLAELKKQQATIEEALTALDAIPGVEKLLDLLRKVGV